MKMKEFGPPGGARPWRPPPLRSANGDDWTFTSMDKKIGSPKLYT